MKNRSSDINLHDYDIVIGPTADENTVTILATNYAEEVLDALINELEPENLPKQYFFGINAAIENLRLKK